MLRRFLTDPWFLFRYYAVSALVLIPAIALFAARTPELATGAGLAGLVVLIPLVLGGAGTLLTVFVAGLALAFAGPWGPASLLHFLWIPVGVAVGLYSAALMHWSVHGNLRPRWLNRAVGELCALHQLLGYPGWGITHLLHHRHPDDPERDAHPPLGLGYWAYGRHMKRAIVDCLDRTYRESFGEEPASRRRWRATKAMLVANRLLRAILVLLLLGPSLFVFLFLPSYLTQMLFYIHFNWATHRPLPAGGAAVCNLDGGLYYRWMNRLLLGSYYHRNHHRNPALFDPRRLVVPPSSELPAPERQ